MRPKTQNILGINPGTRYLALAVFSDLNLKDWRIKVLKGKWSQEKLQKAAKILDSAIVQHQIDALSLKRLHPSRSSAGLNVLVKKIRSVAKRKQLRLHEYTISQMEEFFSSEKPVNRKELAAIIAEIFPDLHNELHREKEARNRYHGRMFEAVALGALAANEHYNS